MPVAGVMRRLFLYSNESRVTRVTRYAKLALRGPCSHGPKYFCNRFRLGQSVRSSGLRELGYQAFSRSSARLCPSDC
jgi:hypothetical protein